MLDTLRRDEAPATAGGSPPLAARLRPPRWRDTRFVLGVLLVLSSVVLGGRLVASADRTVPMPVTTTAVAAGMRLDAADTRLRDVRLDGDHPYLVGAVPAGSIVLRDLAAGELIPADALGSAQPDPSRLRYVTVPVPTDQLPDGLGPGQLVDVYVTGDPAGAAVGGSAAPAAPAAPAAAARLVASAVPIDGLPDDTSAFGVAGDSRRVTLVLRRDVDGAGSDERFQALIATVVAAGRSGDVVLVGVPQATP